MSKDDYSNENLERYAAAVADMQKDMDRIAALATLGGPQFFTMKDRLAQSLLEKMFQGNGQQTLPKAQSAAKQVYDYAEAFLREREARQAGPVE